MPTYRALEHGTNLGHGFYAKGALIVWSGWPRCISGSVEPADEGASAIMRFWWSNHLNAFCPPTPFNHEHNTIFLPAVLPGNQGKRAPALPREPHPRMPQYRCSYGRTFGNIDVKTDEKIFFLGWPVAGLGLDPVNDAARRVVDYYKTHQSNPALLSSPFCLFANDVFLPPLPEPRRKRADDETMQRHNAAAVAVSASLRRGARRRR
jgi:hypothetical protein